MDTGDHAPVTAYTFIMCIPQDSRFMADFLSAWCVCNGRPIVKHQGAAMLKLLLHTSCILYFYILDYIVENLLHKVTALHLCTYTTIHVYCIRNYFTLLELEKIKLAVQTPLFTFVNLSKTNGNPCTVLIQALRYELI